VSDKRSAADLNNAQLILQSTTGCVPQAFLKFVSGDRVSFEMGKLPSLIGVESTFTFENAEIERGLLWNQTSSVSDGIQLNYADGPLNVSVSWNDGYYSARYNWLTALNGGAEIVGLWRDQSWAYRLFHICNAPAAEQTPLPQNNSAILDIAYTASLGRWAFTRYLQLSRVPRSAGWVSATGRLLPVRHCRSATSRTTAGPLLPAPKPWLLWAT
jgi:hypothetical protein